MSLILLLAVVGSAVAAPQFNPRTTFLTPPTTNFLPQNTRTQAFAPQTNIFQTAPQTTAFQTAPAQGSRLFQLDSSVFAPEGGVVRIAPAEFNRGTFTGAVPQAYKLIKRTEFLNDNHEFSSSFQQDNGHEFSETGSLRRTNDGLDNVVVKQGSFSYTSPEGIPVSVTYTADEYGFHPVSSSIPLSVAPIPATF